MAGPVSTGTGAGVSGSSGISYRPALTLLASLFFMWGFITVINGTLLPHLRSVFDLNYTQTTLIESVWFIAYFFASIPSAKLIERVGYQRSLVIGLLIMAAGALGMTLAASLPSYGVTLVMLFVIASGITLLQVAANPYVAVIGPAATSSSRLNLDAFLRQAQEYREGGDGFDRIRRLMTELSLTHSPPVRRAHEVHAWVQSGDYDRIVGGEYLRRGEEPPARDEAAAATEHYAERFRGFMTDAAGQAQSAGEKLADWLRRDPA